MFKITQFPIFVKLLKYAIFIRRFLGTWMHDNKTMLLHLEAGVLTWRQCNNSYFLFNTIKYILCTMHAYFGNFSCPNSTKKAKITWPVSMATRFKSHKSDTGFWLFALKDTSCTNFIKIGDYRFPPIFEILRSLQRSHFKRQCIWLSNRVNWVRYICMRTCITQRWGIAALTWIFMNTMNAFTRGGIALST